MIISERMHSINLITTKTVVAFFQYDILRKNMYLGFVYYSPYFTCQQRHGRNDSEELRYNTIKEDVFLQLIFSCIYSIYSVDYTLLSWSYLVFMYALKCFSCLALKRKMYTSMNWEHKSMDTKILMSLCKNRFLKKGCWLLKIFM